MNAFLSALKYCCTLRLSIQLPVDVRDPLLLHQLCPSHPRSNLPTFCALHSWCCSWFQYPQVETNVCSLLECESPQSQGIKYDWQSSPSNVHGMHPKLRLGKLLDSLYSSRGWEQDWSTCSSSPCPSMLSFTKHCDHAQDKSWICALQCGHFEHP